jgi:rubredoxin
MSLSPAETLAAAAPDWEAIPHDVLCPLCDYNLRGLSDPRCPECGARFDWAEVTDPEKRLHPYLFEHHPERNVRSFVQTLLGTLRPRRFWSGLSPTQPLRPRRMRLYWLITALIASLAFWAEWGRAVFTWWDQVFSRGWIFATPNSGIPVAPPRVPFSWDHLWSVAWVAWRSDGLLGLTFTQLAFWLAWPWLMLLSLQVFRVSMRRAKVRTGHVLRCVVYSFDVGVWFALAGVLWTAYEVVTWGSALSAWAGGSQREHAFRALGFLATSLVIVTWRMWRAYRTYMRFDHALGTIIAAQVISLLVVLNWMLAWENWIRHGF